MRGANVRGRLVTPDVLLAGLEREAVSGISLGVDRDPDEATGDLALELVSTGNEGRVRTTESERDAEALAGADTDIRAHGTG